MDVEEADTGGVSFRRKPIAEIFSRRGEFSPVAISVSPRRSEIPRNTLEFEPRDLLFGGRGGCCGCRRWFRRHSRSIARCGTAAVCITVIALLIGSVAYHLTRTQGSIKKDYNRVNHIPQPSSHPVMHKNPQPIQITKEEEDVGGISIESLSPLDAEPPRHRIVAEVLEDSRELDDLEDLLPRGKLLALELSRAKLRYRRSFPSYYTDRKYYKSDCNGKDCNDDEVGSPRTVKSVKTKLDTLLAEIREIKVKLREYEVGLGRYTKIPFRDFSLTHPTRRRQPLKVTLPYLQRTTQKPFSPLEVATSEPSIDPEQSASPSVTTTASHENYEENIIPNEKSFSENLEWSTPYPNFSTADEDISAVVSNEVGNSTERQSTVASANGKDTTTLQESASESSASTFEATVRESKELEWSTPFAGFSIAEETTEGESGNVLDGVTFSSSTEKGTNEKKMAAELETAERMMTETIAEESSTVFLQGTTDRFEEKEVGKFSSAPKTVEYYEEVTPEGERFEYDTEEVKENSESTDKTFGLEERKESVEGKDVLVEVSTGFPENTEPEGAAEENLVTGRPYLATVDSNFRNTEESTDKPLGSEERKDSVTEKNDPTVEASSVFPQITEYEGVAKENIVAEYEESTDKTFSLEERKDSVTENNDPTVEESTVFPQITEYEGVAKENIVAEYEESTDKTFGLEERKDSVTENNDPTVEESTVFPQITEYEGVAKENIVAEYEESTDKTFGLEERKDSVTEKNDPTVEESTVFLQITESEGFAKDVLSEFEESTDKTFGLEERKDSVTESDPTVEVSTVFPQITESERFIKENVVAEYEESIDKTFGLEERKDSVTENNDPTVEESTVSPETKESEGFGKEGVLSEFEESTDKTFGSEKIKGSVEEKNVSSVEESTVFPQPEKEKVVTEFEESTDKTFGSEERKESVEEKNIPEITENGEAASVVTEFPHFGTIDADPRNIEESTDKTFELEESDKENIEKDGPNLKERPKILEQDFKLMEDGISSTESPTFGTTAPTFSTETIFDVTTFIDPRVDGITETWVEKFSPEFEKISSEARLEEGTVLDEELWKTSESSRGAEAVTVGFEASEDKQTTQQAVQDPVRKLPDAKLDSLEEEMFAGNREKYPPSVEPTDNVRGISLQDARSRKLATKNRKFASKVVGGSPDTPLPTGPDVAIGLGESLKTGQQLSIYPNSFSHVVVPYQMCFYGNPSTKGLPSIREQEPKSFEYHHLSLQQPFVLPGFKVATTPSPPPAASYFNIYMNNNPVPQPSYLSSPGVLTFPSQQHMARYLNSHQQPLFCSTLQGYHFPTVPGTTEFAHARCLNCDDPAMISKEKTTGTSSSERDTDILSCPEDMSRCKDDELCIPSLHWCDGRVHCGDASDELHCSCRDRLSDARRCDGYPDCPDAEDELHCFDCPASSFSCGSWDQDGACIPLSKRCDGATDCPNGHDEVGCSVLAPALTNASLHVSYDKGFLLRNWRGTWYPVCSENGRQTWAEQACALDSTTSGDLEAEKKDISGHVKGPFLTHRADGDLVLEHHCKGHVALHVSCAPARCGTRVSQHAEDRSDFASRFRRLVEEGDPPEGAEDRPILAWWEKVKEEVASRFNVKDVIARLYPLTDSGGSSGGGRQKREGKGRGRRLGKRGRRNENRGRRQEGGRVVGGKASSPHSWPWAVGLYKDGGFHCGGVLLDQNWVLTAAHCVTKFVNHYYEVRVGLLRRFSFAPMEQVRAISHVIMHEDYDQSTMKNDLAVLKMAAPVLLGRWVRPACLPVRGRASREGPWGPAPGTRCVAIGWGAVKEHGTDPDQLREVEIPILERCKHREDIEGDEICAGVQQGGKDTCQGDSGGPLMCRDSSSEGAWYVAGVVSHGEGCARPDEAGAYTRISLYVDWLTTHTTDELPSVQPLQTCPGFRCTSHPRLCISSRVRCNGLVNCLGGEDEEACHQPRSENKQKSFSPTSDAPEPILKLKRQQPSTEEPLFNYTVTPPSQMRFKCRSVRQNVPRERRCDGVQDCEDASDELDCTCRDLLARESPSHICDGIPHCSDLTDELSCHDCPDGYFNCRKSRQCVQMERKCDETPDCIQKEDESDCLGLSEKLNLVVDRTGEPIFESKGFLIENRKGSWSILCVNRSEEMSSRVISRVCHHLGLSSFEAFRQVPLGDVILRVTDHSSGYLSPTDVRSSAHCTGVSVECSKRIGQWGTRDDVTPGWEVRIWENGSMVCSAALMTDEWILASQHCLSNASLLETWHMVAELGRSVYPPVMIRIDSFQLVDSTDILLLHLETPVNESRLIRPLQVPYWKSGEDLQKCVAMAGNTSVAITVSDVHCGPRSFCAVRETRSPRRCLSKEWVGVVVCHSDDSWLPVGVFKEIGGLCGFQRSNFTNILHFIKQIREIIDKPPTARPEAPCEGMRCLGGLCIPPQKVCDGWPQCPYADDEGEPACDIHQNSTPGCFRHELQCRDGGCIPRTQFGDMIAQCGDGSDEPDNCTVCATYLQTVAPWRLCDGTRNCLDKSDERPEMCQGRGAEYVCNSSNVRIPQEFVCDGQDDCGDSDDEKHCVGLQKAKKTLSKEYEFRNMSYGHWHSVCGASPSQSTADSLCVAAGHEVAYSVRIKQMIPRILTLDHYSAVTLNNVTKIILRGDRPFVTLKLGSKPCPIAYVTCV